MSSNVKFNDNSVCFDGNEQWFASIEDGQLISACGSYGAYYDDLIGNDNFQLNTIKQGDFIATSELDTEQKYNDAVEVFGLFGFKPSIQPLSYQLLKNSQYGFLLLYGGVFNTSIFGDSLKRKITYPQLIVIGKLKRAMIDLDETFLGEPKSDFVEAINKVKELEKESTSISTDSDMKRSTCTTYTAEIYIAGDIPVEKQLLREYCLQGFCVSIEPVDYIYTMGEESDMVVRVINYPRFPQTQDEIKQKGVELGELLIKGLHSGSCSVVCKDETIFLSRRDKD